MLPISPNCGLLVFNLLSDSVGAPVPPPHGEKQQALPQGRSVLPSKRAEHRWYSTWPVLLLPCAPVRDLSYKDGKGGR